MTYNEVKTITTKTRHNFRYIILFNQYFIISDVEGIRLRFVSMTISLVFIYFFLRLK